jgi:peptidoglycan/LPS O-acetylase OafA/YrhL
LGRRRSYLRSIEGTRGLAALSILAYHTTQLSNGHGYLETATSRFWLGVPLFFVLSGFLLYRPFAQALVQGRPRPSIVRYARHRVLRIVPAYWIVLSVSIFQIPGFYDFYPAGISAAAICLWAYIWVRRPGALSYAAATGVTIFAIYKLTEYPFHFVTWPALANYALVYIPFAPFTGVVGQAWSLCIEISFYLFLPMLAIVAGRYAARGLTPEARAGRLALGLVPLLPLGLAVMWASGAGTQQVTLAGYIDEFAAGMMLAVALERWPTVSVRTGRLMLGTAISIAVAANLHNRLGPHDPYGNGSGLIFPRLMVIAFALTLASVLMRDEQTILGRVLSSRILVAAGTVSYGIYLWHFLIIQRLGTTRLWWTEGTNLLLVLGLTLAAATASWLAIERPLLRVKDDLGSLRRPRRKVSRQLLEVEADVRVTPTLGL